MESGPHFLIWSCAKKLRITPSLGRSTVQWDANKTQVLFGVRGAPYWDTGFVESAMPPLKLSDGNLLFFYDSVGPWNGTGGFQPGWAVLSGADPTRVLARAQVPPLPYTLPWEVGTRPLWPCNTRNVANLGGGHAVPGPNPLGDGDDLFRVYFGGADAVVGSALISVKLAPASGRFSCSASGGAGLGQCVPAANGAFASYAACAAACPRAPAPAPSPSPSPAPAPGHMVPGRLYTDTDIFGDNVGTSDGATPHRWQDCQVACEAQDGCAAFSYDNRSSCPEGPCCWLKGPHIQAKASPGRLSMVLTGSSNDDGPAVHVHVGGGLA